MRYPFFMSKPFRQALQEHIERTGLSLKTVAERADVSYEQLKKVNARASASTNVDDAVKIAGVFGMTLNEFVADDLAQARADVAKLYSQLTPAEIRVLRAAAKGLPDLDLEAS